MSEVMPVAPSATLMSLIVNVGAGSSFVIVPVPESSAIVAPFAFVRSRVNPSLVS